MPFTPFHFGPGLFAKGVAPRHFSWSAFIASQVVIDCESLNHILRREYPIHRFLHTFVGATLAGLLTGAALAAAVVILRRVFQSRSWPSGMLSVIKSESSSVGLIAGALVGGLSHPLLDGLMHRDIRPFSPWRVDNPFLGLVSEQTLHVGCIGLGFLGAILVIQNVNRHV